MTDTVVVTELSSGVVEVVSQGPQGPSGLGTATAGGVLSGNYPNPGFAVDMATQAELDAVSAAKQSVSGKDASGGYPGLTLFKLNLRNAANTFTSWFTTAATAARTWTMPDKDGTVAMTSDFAAPGAIGGTTPAAGTFTTLTSTGNAALGDTEASDTHAIKGATTLLANSASAALTVTQTGAGNAFVVEDSASTDSTPFVIDASGKVVVGGTASVTTGLLEIQDTGSAPFALVQTSDTSTNASWVDAYRKRATGPVVLSGDRLGGARFFGNDGTNYIEAARLLAEVDGTPGTNDMPGRLVFSTTADGASSPTERMRIDSAGNVGIGATPTRTALLISKALTGTATVAEGVRVDGEIQVGITATARGFISVPTKITGSTLNNLFHFEAQPGAFSGTVTNQFGFYANSAITGAANNYGFYGDIPAGTGRWNFYAAGTADNYFGGNVTVGGGGTLGYGAGSGGTVTQVTSRTTGVTLNKPSGGITLVSAAGSSTYQSLTVTNSAVAATDSIICVQKSGTDLYEILTTNVAAGSFRLTYRTTGGTTTEQPVFHFDVIKGSAS